LLIFEDGAIDRSAHLEGFFASTQETPLLLPAFCAIENPLIRGEIIRTAHDAASLTNIKRPPRGGA
jgi:hypothetical protein